VLSLPANTYAFVECLFSSQPKQQLVLSS